MGRGQGWRKGQSSFDKLAVEIGKRMPPPLRNMLRVPVAVWELDCFRLTVQRLSTRKDAEPEPPRCRVELWTIDADGHFVEPRIKLRCAWCGAKADARDARNWRARNKDKSWVPPWHCNIRCRERAEKEGARRG